MRSIKRGYKGRLGLTRAWGGEGKGKSTETLFKSIIMIVNTLSAHFNNSFVGGGIFHHTVNREFVFALIK